jgi:AcrR family transcriptional regulator
MEQTRKQTVRKPTAARREEVALAALRLIGAQGLSALTTANLAAEVGLTTGALFRHFASLEAILAETVSGAIARVEETFPAPDAPPLDRLLDLADRRVRLLAAEPGIAWMLRSEQALLSLPADAVAELRSLGRRSRDYLVEALRDGARDGTIRADIEPEILVVPVLGTIHTLAGLSAMHGRRRRAREQEIEKVLGALRRLLAPVAP